MRAYTIQDRIILENFTSDTFSPFDYEVEDSMEDEIELGHFEAGYLWMKEKMIEGGLVPARPDNSLIWFFSDREVAEYTFLRNIDTVNSNLIMLEVELPEDCYLTTDFTGFHWVLNGWNLDLKEELESEIKEVDDEVMIDSWDQIIHSIPEVQSKLESRTLQHTTWELRDEWIQSVTHRSSLFQFIE